MIKTAPKRHIIIFIAALIAGASYIIPVVGGWHGPAITAWKGLGVGLLTLWAALNAENKDGWLIAVTLFFYAAGDVLLDALGLEKGAVAFVIGHCLAIWLFLRNRRPALSPSQRLLAYVIPPFSIFIVWALLNPNPGWWHAALYTLFVALMASTAWASRFPRYRTGIGAMMFLISDLVIFAREGDKVSRDLGALLIWPLYFTGVALIAWGVVTRLKRAHDWQ